MKKNKPTYRKFTATIDYIRYYRESRRHRKERHSCAHMDHEFLVVEPDARDFPLALTVTNFGTRQEGLRDYDDYDGNRAISGYYDTEFRMYGKRLFRPVRWNAGACEGDIVDTIDYLVERIKLYTFSFSVSREYGVPIEDTEVPEGAIYTGSNFDEALGCLRKATREYLWFDGKLWIESEEPRYTYVTFGMGGNHGGTGFFIVFNGHVSAGRSRVTFSANERSLAIREAVRAARDRGDTDDIDRLKGSRENIKVHLRRAVTPIVRAK